MSSLRPVWLLLALAASLLLGCTSAPDAPPAVDDPASTGGDVPDLAEDAATDVPSEPCRRDGLEDEAFIEVTGSDPSDVATRIADRTHACATTAVVVPADDDWAALLAVSVALAADAPLLLHDAEDPASTHTLLDRLDAEDVVTVGLTLDGLGIPSTSVVVPEDTPPADGSDPDGDATEGPPNGGSPTDGSPTDGSPADGAATADADTSDAADEDPHSDDRARFALALLVAEHLGVEHFVAVPDDDRLRAAAATHTGGEEVLLPIPDDDAVLADLAETMPVAARIKVLAGSQDDDEALAGRLLGVGLDAERLGAALWSDAASTAWLGDPRQGATFAAAAVAALGRDEVILPVDAGDLRSRREDTDRLRDGAVDRTVLVGEVTDDAEWQLRTVARGRSLPSGGFRLFENERMVALYGHPGSSALGALGEQDLEATVERLRAVAEPYGADGSAVLPAFEIITSIASAEAGPRGDYSRLTPIDTIRPWVDRAAEEGMYVLLDLQPGRTDFLTQAQEYEELLREPHVGLALDPEWRLGPDEVHLRQIGSVRAEEVQQVADWLAQLTREALLPEKLLVLHQFRFSMLPDRDDIVAPAELAVVVHMDGQGPIGTKYDTYGAITAGVEDRWLWGWKNFYDEDLPTPTPEQVLALDPVPVLVTYQ